MKKVFISYAREDIRAARLLYEALRAVDSIEPWFDQVNLLPGMKWEPAIRKAIRESEFFLALLSKQSNTKRGYVQKERKNALDVLDEFPEGQIYFIPIRLEECDLPSEAIRGLQYVDLFPDWQTGLQQIIKSIDAGAQESELIRHSTVLTGYEYRCGIVDLDNGLTNLPEVCRKLNSLQTFFNFSHPTITLKKCKPRKFEGAPNLFVDGLPKSIYEQKADYLNVDLVSCLTKYLLAFDDGLAWNYLSLPSNFDDTYLFISTNQLYEASKHARCTFEKAIVYNILSQLVVYFASNLGFHKKLRGCILDYCNDRSEMLPGLTLMRLCEKCASRLRNSELKSAIESILRDELKV